MRILHITAQKPHSTGSGVYLTELVRALDRMGMEQAVVAGVYRRDSVQFPQRVSFTPVYYRDPERPTDAADIPYAILGMSDVMPYPSTRYRALTAPMVAEMREAFGRAIRAAAQRLKPELVLCHHLYLLTAMVPGLLRDVAPEARTYGISHGSDLRQLQSCPLHRAKILRGIGSLDGVFALHRAQAADIARLYGIPAERIPIIGSGYNAAVFRPRTATEQAARQADACIRIIYAGKLSREKGLFPLLDALAALVGEKHLPPFQLSLAGGCQDPDIRAALFGCSAAEPDPGPLTGLPYPANYLGVLSQESLAAAFRASDIFVLPSYYEGLPLVLIEAMASGLLPICSDLPGVCDWIDQAVGRSGVRYVPLPRMRAPGIPEAEALPLFTEQLRDVLGRSIRDVRQSSRAKTAGAPDTSRASWAGVAHAVLEAASVSTASADVYPDI